jgi:hypothetical protein
VPVKKAPPREKKSLMELHRVKLIRRKKKKKIKINKFMEDKFIIEEMQFLKNYLIQSIEIRKH